MTSAAPLLQFPTPSQRMPDPYMSLVQASKLTRLPRHSLLTMAVKGEISAQTVAGRIVVLRADVERIVAERNASK